MTKNDRYMVGLDIGTSNVNCIVAESRDPGPPAIVGIGSAPSRGLRKGVVVNLESCVEAIKRAVEEAELMAGVTAERAHVGIAGSHIRSVNGRGVVAIAGRDRTVTREDVTRVLDAAKAISIPQDQEILHVVPQEFVVDDQDGIHHPVGMSGSRLEALVHIVTGSISSVQTLVNCVNRAGIEVVDTILEQFASAEAVLTSDEREMGVALVDIGGGTTDIAVFERGSVVHTSVLPTGGDHFTSDIAIGLRTPIPEAEKIKKKYGCALASMIGEDEMIEVPTMGGRKPRVLSRQVLCEIVQPRAEEIFGLVQDEIKRCGYDKSIAAGLVLTGGGSILEGIPEIAEQLFDLPVRRASPTGIGGLADVVASPQYATAIGLLLYGAKHRAVKRRSQTHETLIPRLAGRVREMIGQIF
jgi:cell division protein FtsA